MNFKNINNIYIILFHWRYGGIESRSYRFYSNLKNAGKNVKLFIINPSKRISNNSLNLEGINFIDKKSFIDFSKNNINENDLVFFFRPGRPADFNYKKNNLDLPFYFDCIDSINAVKGLYIYGNSELQFMPYYNDIIERVDFLASAFLVNSDSHYTLLKDNFRNEKHIYKKPIWFFNASLSPKEYDFCKLQLDNNFKNKHLKNIVYTGRITPEKNIGKIVESFVELSKENFDCKIYGNYKETRELWFNKTKYPKENIEKFFMGEYNTFTDSKKILNNVSIGINLRKKNFEKYHVLENTVLEYSMYGVVPLIDKFFIPESTGKGKFKCLEYEEGSEKKLYDIIKDNFNNTELLNDIRINNLNYLLKNNNGNNILKSFEIFLKNYL